MKALRFERAGNLRDLAYVSCATPEPGSDEVLIRVRAAGINRSDVANVMGFFPYTTVPRIPGRDFAGVVVEGPTALVGKAVWGSGREIGFTRDGSHAEYLLLPADAVALKPAALSFEQAGSCGVPYVTAWYALENAKVAAHTSVVVIGAAGGVGIAAIHLARMRGARVVAAVRQHEQAHVLAGRGFATCLLVDGHSLGEPVREHFADGAEVIIDCSGYWPARSVDALARFGRLITMVVPAQDGCVNLPIRDFYRIGASIVGVNSLLYSAAECARMLTAIGSGFEQGMLAAPDALEPRPLATGAQVYAMLRAGHRGKCVLVPDADQSDGLGA